MKHNHTESLVVENDVFVGEKKKRAKFKRGGRRAAIRRPR